MNRSFLRAPQPRRRRRPGALSRRDALKAAVTLAVGATAGTATAASQLAAARPAAASGGSAPSIEATRTASSPAVLVSPVRPLEPATYVPEDLVQVPGAGVELVRAAADAVVRLLDDARAAGHRLILESGYRSYTRQAQLFDGYVAKYGRAYAQKISAVPGTSEHQLGLAVDLGLASGECSLHRCFGDTPAGRWVAEHAVAYGFIIRYPDGHFETTGYNYEPWHLRYLGPEIAADVAHSGFATYEEYVHALEAAADVVSTPVPRYLPPEASSGTDSGTTAGPGRRDLSWLPSWLAERLK